MASPDDSGKFTTDIPKEVLDAAMDAVDKRTKGGRKQDAGEVEVVTVESGADETQETPPPDPAPADPATDKDHEIEQLQAQLEVSMAKGRELMGKIKDEHEKMLRAVADLENYKKRAAKEKEEVQRFGIEKLMRDFLPVVDNFDRALEHAQKSNDMESLKKGVEMIRKLFEDALGKHGVKPFVALNKPFDPNFHEAMGQAESKDLPPNHVAAELVRGFTLNERLLRAALVMVSKAPEAEKPAAPPEEAKAETPAPDGEKKS